MAKNTASKKPSAKNEKKAPPKGTGKPPKKATGELSAADIDALDDAEKVAAMLDERGVEYNAEASLEELKDLLRGEPAAGESDEDEDEEEDEEEEPEVDEKPAAPAKLVLKKEPPKPPAKFDAPRDLAKVVVPKDLKDAETVVVVDASGVEIRRYTEAEHGQDFAKLAVMFAGKEPGRKAVAL